MPLTFPIVSIDPYKRTKIWYAAGFVVASMSLTFVTYTMITTREQAVILGSLSLVFILVGAFLYLKAGKVNSLGELTVVDGRVSMQRSEHLLEFDLSSVDALEFTDEGMHRYNGNFGKILKLTFYAKGDNHLKSCSLYFISEKNIAELLKPVKSAGIRIKF
jgi:hypothetical protein